MLAKLERNIAVLNTLGETHVEALANFQGDETHRDGGSTYGSMQDQHVLGHEMHMACVRIMR